MYITTYKCLICYKEYKREFPNTEIWDVEWAVNEDELALVNGKIYCDGCAQVSPMEMVIYDDISCEVISKKIISPYHYTNHEMFDEQGNKTIPCDMCRGEGSIEIAKKAHHKEDLLFIDFGDCPICAGKGYLEIKKGNI